jgi:DNA-binding SARP family transcriptional activator/tetratricopeptide (TPR) repeat protein
MSGQWDFLLLGAFEARFDGHPVQIRAAKHRILLASLLLEPNRTVTVDALATRLWGDEDHDRPLDIHRTVQTYVFRLRRTFGEYNHDYGGVGSGGSVDGSGIGGGAGGEELVVTRPGGYAADVPESAVDVHRFNLMVAEGAGIGDPAAASAAMHEALALWRGDALMDVPSPSLHRQFVPLLAEGRLTAVERQVEADLRLGRHDALVGQLQSLTSRYPLRERFWAQLMYALDGAGRQAEALAAYVRIRGMLTDELGVEPGPDLREAHRRVLQADRWTLAAGSDSAAPDSTAPDSVSPESQDAETARESGAASRSVPVPRQLPPDVADFTGRADEADRIVDLLGDASSRARVVLITGQGGIGKTTLAVHAAHQLAERFPDGQLFVDLHGYEAKSRGPREALAPFLRALGVAESALPDDVEERCALLRSLLAERRVLIVLDNASGYDQIRALLPAAPGCAALVTSRARLSGLPGARTIELDVLPGGEARALFATIVGAERLEAEPAQVGEVLRHCGGLPLALRIAAAKLVDRPHWRVAELSSRLTDAKRRLSELSHGAMDVRSTVDLSYRMLQPDARVLFRRIGLLEAPSIPGWIAAALLDRDLAGSRDLLEELVDARLVEAWKVDGPEAVRYRCHDLVRAYARELAARDDSEADRAEALGRAFGAWLAFAQEAHIQSYGGDYTILHGQSPRWRPADLAAAQNLAVRPLRWLDSEHAALCTAVRQAGDLGFHELAWDLAGTCVTLFEAYGYFDDWKVTCERALAATRTAGNRRGTAAMLRALTSRHVQLRDYSAARNLNEDALRLFREIGDPYGTVLCEYRRCQLDLERGDAESAFARLPSVIRRLRAADDPSSEVAALRAAAKAHLRRGDPDSAMDCLRQAEQIAARTGGARTRALVAHSFGGYYLHQNQPEAAEQAYREAARAIEVGRDRNYGEVHVLLGLGEALAAQHKTEAAVETLERAARLAGRTGDHFIETQVVKALRALRVPEAVDEMRA